MIFTTDLNRFRSSVRSRAPSGPVGSSRHRSRAGSSGDKYTDMLLTDADRKERIARIEHTLVELSALMKPDDKK